MIAINIIFLAVVAFILFWQVSLIVAIAGGAPSVSSKKATVEKTFEAVNLKAGEVVLDLGCGNGKVLILSAKKYGAKGLGIEISPFYYLLAKINVLFSGEAKNIKIYFGNFFTKKEQIKNADVVFLFLFDKVTNKIEPFVFENKKNGARIVSVSFPFKNHSGKKIVFDPAIYLYAE